MKNSEFYLRSQPEMVEFLNEELVEVLRKDYSESEVEKLLQKITLPEKTIIHQKEEELQKILSNLNS